MTDSYLFRSADHVATSVAELASFVTSTSWPDLPHHVRARLSPMLTDLLGVTVAGMRTPELRSLVAAWNCPPGDAPLLGTSVHTTPETAARLSAIAACALELDEGNKYAAGHPAAHVVFAAIAAAQEANRAISGEEFLRAVALGYEVAARFGHATQRDPRWHTHGHWGVTGSACAATVLLGGSADQVAAAIDSATGLMHVTPWQTVLTGDFTRNLWVADANTAGLHAARLALAGLVRNRGAAAYSLGDLVGTLDPDQLVDGLGERWLVAEGYAKRHSSCSYTHAAVDLVQALRATGWWQVEDVAHVRVGTHSLAAPLLGRHPENRLAAMFSFPFVVSTAMVSGSVAPSTMEPGTRAFAEAERFSDRVLVVIDERLDGYLPDLRCTEVAIELVDGTMVSLGQRNPIGDADHFPLGATEVAQKLHQLIGANDAAVVGEAIDRLERCRSVVTPLDCLP